MFIKLIFMLILSIHFTTTVSDNSTSISNSGTQNHQNSTLLDIFPKIKPNEIDKKLLSRGIANTSIVHEPNNSGTSAVKIVTEGSGVTKVDGTSIVFSGPKVNAGNVLASSTPASPTIFDNSTKTVTHFNETNSMENNNTIKTTLVPHEKTPIVVVKSSTTTTTTSTTSTSTTTTTTTTTTKRPKKPTLTYPSGEIPGIKLSEVNVDSSSSNNKFPSSIKSSSTKLSVEDPEIPHVQPSQELDGGIYRSHRDYIIPIVSIIFAVPILMGMVIVAYRRFRDFWSTRHYRRMDFLVDGMYND